MPLSLAFPAPRLPGAPRAGALAAVGALHVAIAVALLLSPAVRQHFAEPAPLFVELVKAPAERTATPPRALPQPTLHAPRRVELPLPNVVMLAEAEAAPPQVAAPAPAAVATAPAVFAPAAAALAVEPPRFDIAYLRNPAPAYPTVSRRMKEHGRVLLHVLVSAAGEAQQVEIRTSSGFERLDHAAIDAVRRWRFAPARRGAEAVAGWALVPVNFSLEG